MFRGAKDFCPNFPNSAKKITSKEKRLHFFLIFQYVDIKAHFKHYFCTNFP